MNIRQHRLLEDRYLLAVAMTPAEAATVAASPHNIGGRLFADPTDSPYALAVDDDGQPLEAVLVFEFAADGNPVELGDDEKPPKLSAAKYEEQQVDTVKRLLALAIEGPDEFPTRVRGKKAAGEGVEL